MRQAIQRALTQEAGTDADAKALAAAARRVYDQLAGHLALLIGEAGVRALTARSLHLAQREFPWLAEARDPEQSDGPFAHVSLCLERQDPAIATAAAATALAIFGGLLAALIGEWLTGRVLRTAWPSGFSDDPAQEAQKR